VREDAIKHLEFIQAVIARQAQNSFATKGWAVSLVAGILVLANKFAGWQYELVALLPAIVFWGLDAFYLRQERLFRKLYDSVRCSCLDETQKSDFNMDISPFSKQVSSLWETCWVGTIAWLYGIMAFVIVVYTALSSWLQKPAV
jgi:hypothetical protein